jgi:divalent metal cation (Fe/Co/Zn/Cd) transporter
MATPTRRDGQPATDRTPAGTDPCAAPCCGPSATTVVARDAAWHRAATQARWLAWASLAWMTLEGALGLLAGVDAGSIALVGWALGSVVEGLASIIVVWRFSGTRTLSETAERTGQRAIAVSFWLLAPLIALESIRHLTERGHPTPTTLGIAVTAASLVLMPVLGRAKQRLARTLGSATTAGEGVQNYLCAAQAGLVLATLLVTATWPGGWWLDGVVGLAIAAWAIREGRSSWRGEECC